MFRRDPLAPYENVRLREQALLERLLTLLRQAEGIPAAHIEQVRDAIFHADHPFLVVLVGAFNSGKSTIINALIGENALETGPTPTTMRITILRHGADESEVRDEDNVYTRVHPAPILEALSFVDTPGLESVFTEHDDITQRFLHRADVVMLVMMATQALSGRNLDDLIALNDYGKPVVILVNQADLLEEDERREVYDFITGACKQRLGMAPPTWLVSAKQGAEAESHEDPAWEQSNMGAVFHYLEETLDDRDRIRKKLNTPLQIGHNVTRAALAQAEDDLQRLDGHRSAVENIRAQIDRAMSEQDEIINEYVAQIDPAFGEAGHRGALAISDMFRLSASLGLLRRGVAELLPFIRTQASIERYAEKAFREQNVRQPLDTLTTNVNKLPPRLEGADLKDMESLADYTRGQIKKLPDGLRDKVIGRVETPTGYRREHWQEAGARLNAIIQEALSLDGDRLERAVRNAVLILAAWELTVALIVVFLAIVGILGTENGVAVLVAMLVLVMVGFVWMPLQAVRMGNRYADRLRGLGENYREVLAETAHEHASYARQVRENTVQPYTRLVATQLSDKEELRDDLQEIEDGLTETEQVLQKL